MGLAAKHNRSAEPGAGESPDPAQAAPRITLARTILDPGSALPPAPLDDERAIHFLEGAGEAEIDGRRRRVAAGDTMRLAAGTRFGVRNTEASPPLVFVAAAPACTSPVAGEGTFARLANRLAWILRRVARRLER
jgi:quercetin dioxygenase-like cupin family protein